MCTYEFNVCVYKYINTYIYDCVYKYIYTYMCVYNAETINKTKWLKHENFESIKL